MKRSTIFTSLSILFILPFSISIGAPLAKNGNGNYYNTKAWYAVNDSSGFVIDPDPAISLNENTVKAGLLYDVDNKKIVWQKDANRMLPIASLTKMMVALLAIEDIHAGKIKWDDNVRWSRETVMRINHKDKTVYTQASYSVRDLFKAAMIASNNECAEALARYLEGNDLQAALDRMNLRARELGMNGTWYGNPTGLPAATAKMDNISTPEDLLLLANEMIKYNEILQVTGMGYADVSNGESVNIIRNHNHLTIDYSGDVDGMKTGYTKRAGFCLVATSKKCGHRLISIVLGANCPEVRNNFVADMLNQYYAAIGEERLTASNVPVVGNDDEEGGSMAYQAKIVKTVHKVNKGETLSAIADQYGCTLTDIVKWNHLRTATLKNGRQLIVYTKEKIQTDSPAQSAENVAPATAAAPVATAVTKAKPAHQDLNKDKYLVYIVQPGDTLARIAQNYNGVTVQQIKTINRIFNSRALRIGTHLKVPVSS